MTFHVITAEPLLACGQGISSPFATSDVALEFARDLVEDGVEVLRIEDDECAIVYDGEAVRAWCEIRRRRPPELR